MGCICASELKNESLNELDLVKVQEEEEINVKDIQDIIEVSEREEHDQPPLQLEEEIKVEEIRLRVDEEPLVPPPQ